MDGSSGSVSSPSWTPVERRDTTPEAAVEFRARWMAMAPAERSAAWFRWCADLRGARMAGLRIQRPGASEAELLALWTEETYRESVDPSLLARACALIRSRGAAGGG